MHDFLQRKVVVCIDIGYENKYVIDLHTFFKYYT